MKFYTALSLLVIFALLGCKELPPKEFVGTWELDKVRTKQPILDSNLNEEDKIEVSASYLDISHNPVWIISKDGYCWLAESPKKTRQKMNINKIGDGVIIVLEPDEVAREFGKEEESAISQISVKDDHLEFHSEVGLGFKVYYKRKK